MARVCKIKYINHAFLLAGALLVLLLSAPRLGGYEQGWINGLYECFCLFIMFPLIIWIGAGGKVNGKKVSWLCKFLGDISYPIYITHFPLIYVYMAYVTNGK